MSTNEIQSLSQSQASRKTADVIENQNFSSPKRTVTVIIPSVSRLTDHGQKKRRVYLVITMGTRKDETAWQPAAAASASLAVAVAAAKDGNFRRHPGACLLHHICIPHRLPVACPPPPRERGHGERSPYACLAFIAPVLCLSFSLTLAHILDNAKRP